ncbi:14339_t:CDS:1, partial [Funneliformis geosporum]
MKIYLPLIATEDVIVHFIKQQNSTLESGDIIGVLILDDSSQFVTRYLLSEFLAMNPPVLVDNKEI